MTLSTFWFLLIAVLWTGFLVLEGFDFGVGMLHGIVGRDEIGRRVAISTISPVWDGNEVWLIVAGAGMFAAFPVWYATMFSGLYLAMALLLLALIMRGLSFEYRGKRESPRWRRFWSGALIGGSLAIPLLVGLALGDLVHGLPINDKQEYTGTFWDLFTGYGVFTGLTIVAICLMHGAAFLALKTTRSMRDHAHRLARAVAPVAAAAVVAFVIWTRASSNNGAVPSWADILAVLAAIASVWLIAIRREGWGFVATTLTMAAVVGSIFVDLYPRVMVSTLGSANDLTVDNASSSPYSLKVMTVVAAILLPVVLLYEGWTYYVFRKRVTRPPAVTDGTA
jgi:cytochrome d ubiquinol oxidase subunit II